MLRSFHQAVRFGKFAIASPIFAVFGCGAASPTSAPKPATLEIESPVAEPADSETASDNRSCTPRVRPPKPIRPVAAVEVAPGDPTGGRFTLDEAIQGLSGRWPLHVEIHTDLGSFSCELWDESAPITVANFVGLARGLRPFRDPKADDRWVRRPAYDGGSFHRIIPGFMIQGGDPLGTGAGDAGYVIPNEIDETIQPDRRGLLYMAHRGPNTGSMQFFILDGPAPHIAGAYTAFGACGPSDVIQAIANAPALRERANPPVEIRSVDVTLSPGCD